MKTILFLLFLSIALTSCGALKVMSGESSEDATMASTTFDFSPPVENLRDTGKITFLLINPAFSTGVTESYQKRNPFRTFIKNMAVDFEEMLVAKGMPHKGPYDNYEGVVFSDKNQADLCLEPEVDIQFTGSALKHRAAIFNGYYTTPEAFWYDGNMSIIGKLNLFCYAPHTHVKLWIKSIPLETKDFYLKSKYKYDSKNIPLSDPGIWKVLVDNMKDMYKSAMITAWRQLDMTELNMKKIEAKKIDGDAGYRRRE